MIASTGRMWQQRCRAHRDEWIATWRVLPMPDEAGDARSGYQGNPQRGEKLM